MVARIARFGVIAAQEGDRDAHGVDHWSRGAALQRWLSAGADTILIDGDDATEIAAFAELLRADLPDGRRRTSPMPQPQLAADVLWQGLGATNDPARLLADVLDPLLQRAPERWRADTFARIQARINANASDD